MNQHFRLHTIKDVTTKSVLLKSKDSKRLSVIEINQNSLVVSMDIKANVGVFLGLEGNILIDEKSVPFDAIGRVKKVDKCEEGFSRFEIELRQHDKVLWARLLDRLSQNQKRADQILKWVKGTDEP